ncbi:uncharacterized protein TRUGW13939_07480 [Talaromyces rugulosus]|uniref:Uncharacterized protein n=1 Tax=Talaromyces rugulosus TaxID=121627 RepID=A0A7H8R2K7_TALRU|nr:uncharacterized protein TRUGW13939_07480 [Talaromyces rugulosus]QKX60336.1 hypothetical protein TRUGW13939_07480 [Talaromyces rugulosus]
MYASKKLDHFDRDHDSSLTLHFTNGSAHERDILIGATALKPYVEAQASIGNRPINAEDACENTWIGDRTFLLNNLLIDGELVQFDIASHNKDTE